MGEGNNIIVKMLGEFSISYAGRTISDSTNRSKKLWIFLEYLITFKEKGATQDVLIELLWGEDNSGDPANALKAIVHRARALVSELGLEGKKLISYQRGSYVWNTSGIPMIVDTEEFEKHLALAEEQHDTEEKLDSYLKALALYSGSFLPQASLEPWAVPIGAYYHTKYLETVKTAIALLEEAGRFHSVVELCHKAVVIDPYDEYLHMALINSLYQNGQQQASLTHYEYVTDMFFKNFGINPSQEFLQLYKKITKLTNAVEQNIDNIKASLSEVPVKSGPFICEYEVFKDVYRIEIRAQARTGFIVCLCLLSVGMTDGSKPEQKLLANSMDKLYDCIDSTLRRNDIVTRFSVSQYLLMLQGATIEASEMVVNRLVRKFRRENPKLSTMVRYRLQPINPLEELEG